MESLKYNYVSIRSTVTYNNTIVFNASGTSLNNWDDKLQSILKNVAKKGIQIKPLIQFLVTAINPAKIYMMKDEEIIEENPESHIDLLIIIPGKSGIAFAELEPILHIAYLQNQQIHCSLHNEGSVLEGLKNGHIFYSLNCTLENLVYDDMVLDYPYTAHDTCISIKEIALKKFEESYAKALQFYECACFIQEKHSTCLIAFMLHQATELTYRGILLSLNGYDKKTHEIRTLKKHSRRCANSLNKIFADNTPEEKNILDILEKAYFNTRYESEYKIDENVFIPLFSKVNSLLCAAKEIVKTKLKQEDDNNSK